MSRYQVCINLESFLHDQKKKEKKNSMTNINENTISLHTRFYYFDNNGFFSFVHFRRLILFNILFLFLLLVFQTVFLRSMSFFDFHK